MVGEGYKRKDKLEEEKSLVGKKISLAQNNSLKIFNGLSSYLLVTSENLWCQVFIFIKQ